MTYHRGPGTGTAVYLTHLRAKSRDFIKGGAAIFLLTMEGKKKDIILINYASNQHSVLHIFLTNLKKKTTLYPFMPLFSKLCCSG